MKECGPLTPSRFWRFPPSVTQFLLELPCSKLPAPKDLAQQRRPRRAIVNCEKPASWPPSAEAVCSAFCSSLLGVRPVFQSSDRILLPRRYFLLDVGRRTAPNRSVRL